MKVALAGCGSLALVYSHAINQIDGISISAVYDYDMEKAKSSFKDNMVVSDYQELLRTDCDAVLLCVPTYLQPAMAKMAADNGKHVICQTPPAINFDEMAELSQYFKSKNIKLIPSMFDRYFGNIQDVKTHLQMNSIGNIGVINLKRYCPKADKIEQSWYNNPLLSGGSLYQLSVCDIDLVRYMLGEARTAFGYHRVLDGVDYSILTLTMECGVLVNIESLFGYTGEYCKSYEISGSQGNIRFNSTDSNSSKVLGTVTGNRPFNIDCSLNNAQHNPYKLMFMDIARRFKEKDSFVNDIDDLLEAYRIADICGKPAAVKAVQL